MPLHPSPPDAIPVQTLVAEGWTVVVAATSGSGPQPTCHLANVEPGSAGAPGRGILAGIAAGAPGMAATALTGLAEGLAAAAPTLGPKRAAAHALGAINTWMLAQSGDTSTALAAFILTGARIGRLSLGDVRFWRLRDGSLAVLEGSVQPPLGQHPALVLPYGDDVAERGDRYIAMIGDCRIVLVLDVLECPSPDASVIASQLSGLMLRAEPREGDLWDGFRLERVLYRGPCTLLMRAWDNDGRRVVLKLPRPGILEDPVFRRGFIREAWVGASIHNRHIAEYLALPPERQSSLYLVLPYYPGETLEQRLLHPPRLGLAEAIGLVLQLCQAVSALAAHGVLHCDLKPDNVIVDTKGQVRLLDLGLAFLPGRDETASSRLGGTMQYMAPELFRGTAPNATTEVFALAVILYRLFTGGKFPPFKPKTTLLTRHRPDLPAWLGPLLAAALAHDPTQRPADSIAFAALLEAGLRSGTAPATRPDSPLAFWRGLAIGLAALALMLLALLLARH